MDKKQLKQVLRNLKPALAINSFVPMYQNYLFDEDKIVAYNTTMGIIYPLSEEGPFKGAVPGTLLYDFVSNCPAEDLTYKELKNSVSIGAGKATIKLPLHPTDEFVFDAPDLENEGGIEIDLDEHFVKGLELSLLSVNENFFSASFCGVHLVYDSANTNTCLYASDNSVLSKYDCKGGSVISEEGSYAEDLYLVLPYKFCTTVLSLLDQVGEGEAPYILIKDDSAIAGIGDYVVYTKLINKEDGLDFAQMFNDTTSNVKDVEPIPEGFTTAIEMASLISNKISVSLDKNQMTFETGNAFGEYKESIDCDHNNKGSVWIEKAQVLNSISNTQLMGLTSEYLYFENEDGNYQYIVSGLRD